ncbi:hypothetical protein AC1031_016235 [Aphanomyces cochlioides]|nr:hypothetical protein AC1031_016232 [Aphanomyces cochlioides]KAG9413218.1 hypothetical protein AC1031_016235 [Aphanomyces cochlioides]
MSISSLRRRATGEDFAFLDLRTTRLVLLTLLILRVRLTRFIFMVFFASLIAGISSFRRRPTGEDFVLLDFLRTTRLDLLTRLTFLASYASKLWLWKTCLPFCLLPKELASVGQQPQDVDEA